MNIQHRIIFLGILLSWVVLPIAGQNTYLTKTGGISFFSKTPLEDIEAKNKQVTSLLDTETGELVFSVLIRSFEFEKALMQEHFNENYMESEIFPKAKFSGKLSDFKAFSWDEKGEFVSKITGQLEIHGVKRDIEVLGQFKKLGQDIRATSEFVLNPKDFNIQIPKIVENKIAKTIKVNVSINYKPYK